jgi:hypothetical protein
MKGDDRVRSCAACSRPVYNVAELTRREVCDLLARHEGKAAPCLRLYKRPDGTVVTRDCFARLRAAARFTWLRIVGFAAVALGFWGGVLVGRSVVGALTSSQGKLGRAPIDVAPRHTLGEIAEPTPGPLLGAPPP